MSRSDRLTTFSKQVGFALHDDSAVLTVVGVPCLLKDGTVSTCSIATSYDTADRRPTEQIGNAVHAVRITIAEERDGLVYQADGTPIGNHLAGDGKTWSAISIHKGWSGHPEKDATANDLIHRYAKRIIGAVAKAGYSNVSFLTDSGPFRFPNTFEARAAIGPLQDRIRQQSIAIIGLGGTGAYLLDLIAKTPVLAIHGLDDDNMEWHNFMRAPGAPTNDELRQQEPLSKVKYYESRYTSLRERIHLHPTRVDDPTTFHQFLSDHPIDFAFVCTGPSAIGRQDVIYCTLSERAIPFIDSGVNITVDEDGIKGAVTTSFYEAGSMEWRGAIPTSRVHGDFLGYRNVQLPEVNALAASLAVIEWRRRTAQYASKDTSFLHKVRLETPTIRTVRQ